MKITDIVFIDGQTNWSFPLHQHDELELSIILEGEGSVSIDGKFYHLEKGDIAIKNAGAIHSEQSIGDQSLTQVCISIDGIDEEGYLPNQLIHHDDSPIINGGDSFDVLKSIGLYLKDHYEDDSLVIEPMLQTFYLIVLELIEKQIRPKKEGIIKESELINEVIDYLNRNYQRPLTLDQLASHFAISKFYLAKKFKERTSVTIGRYLSQRRIGEAERMLIFENLSIKEIAHSNGFSNIQYFYKVFKKETGSTPIEFRNKFKK